MCSTAMNFAGKVVLITGAGSGIGAATALKFTQLGACLSMIDCNEESIKKTAEQCKKADSDSSQLVMVGDITKEEETKCLMQRTIERYGKLDVLVNNAGILESGTIENTSLEQFDRILNLNLRAVLHLTMLAVPELLKSKGNIVNVCSVNGIRSFPNVLAYNISKAGVDMLNRCVALELGLRGVRSNCINPGVILTNLHTSGGMSQEEYKKFLARAKDTHALGRAGTPEEAANAIIYLASDLASFSTGNSFSVDGGRHAMCPR